jgi:hypothetical protein
MLPASDLSEILTNLSALNLQPNTTAQILAAVLAPLLRSADPEGLDLPRKRARRPRLPPRRALRRKRKKSKPRVAVQSAPGPPTARASAPPARSPPIRANLRTPSPRSPASTAVLSSTPARIWLPRPASRRAGRRASNVKRQRTRTLASGRKGFSATSLHAAPSG